MNRYLSDPRIRRLARVEVALLVVVVGLGVFLYYGREPRAEASEDRTSIERRLASARGDLADLRSGAAADALREELRRLEATVPPELPPIAEALDFGAAVTEYASSQLLAVDAFDVASATYETGGVTYPAISYSIAARGPIEVLVGLLSLPTRFATSIVQDLELTRVPEAADEWLLRLTLVVVHSGA